MLLREGSVARKRVHQGVTLMYPLVVMWGVTATSAQHGELAMAQRCLQCAFISYPGWAFGWIWNYWFIDEI